MKLPLRPFFRVTGMLIFYMGFKFGAAGLHSLRVAGAIPSTPIAGLSSHAMALLLGALAIWMLLRASQRCAGRLGAGARPEQYSAIANGPRQYGAARLLFAWKVFSLLQT